MVRIGVPEMCARVYERAMKIESSDALTNRARLFDGWQPSLIVRVALAGLADALRETITWELLVVSDDFSQ